MKKEKKFLPVKRPESIIEIKDDKSRKNLKHSHYLHRFIFYLLFRHLTKKTRSEIRERLSDFAFYKIFLQSKIEKLIDMCRLLSSTWFGKLQDFPKEPLHFSCFTKTPTNYSV